MNEIVIWIAFSVAVIVFLAGLWVITNPELPEKIKHWQRKRAGKKVEYKFVVNGKVQIRGKCAAGDTKPVGNYQIYPEKQLGELMIVPVRYVKSFDVRRHAPMRVARNSICMLEVHEIDE